MLRQIRIQRPLALLAHQHSQQPVPEPIHQTSQPSCCSACTHVRGRRGSPGADLRVAIRPWASAARSTMRSPSVIAAAVGQMHADFWGAGLMYAPGFRMVQRGWSTAGGAVIGAAGVPSVAAAGLAMAPATTDGMLQTGVLLSVASERDRNTAEGPALVVPAGIGSVMSTEDAAAARSVVEAGSCRLLWSWVGPGSILQHQSLTLPVACHFEASVPQSGRPALPGAAVCA